MLLKGQEVIVTQKKVAVALRVDIGLWKYIIVDPSNLKIQTVEASKYLELKENLSGQRELLQAVASASLHLTCCILSMSWACTVLQFAPPQN